MSMRRLILDVVRISGKVTCGMVIFVSFCLIGCFGYTAIMKNSFSLPFNWLAFSYQTTASGGYGVQMDFTQGAISAVCTAMICMSLFIIGIQKYQLLKNKSKRFLSMPDRHQT